MLKKTNIGIYDGISCDPSWSLSRFKMVIKLECSNLSIETIYNYDYVAKQVALRQNNKTHSHNMYSDKEVIFKTDIDPFLWELFTTKIEETRVFIEISCREYGVNELESFILSLKFVWNVLKKFRNLIWKEFNANDDRREYDSIPFKEAISVLITRFEMIIPHEYFMFSKIAADDKLAAFRKEAAYETVQYLEEETGAIFHSKLTL